MRTAAGRQRGLPLWIAFILFAVMCAPVSAFAEPDYTQPPEIGAPAAFLINLETGAILYEKNADEMRAPASTTKIMTALLAIERLPLDQIVTIDWETEAVSDVQIYLQNGEQISVNDLLYATLVPSANDAAVALAKAVAGTIPDFANLMNERAQQIGAVNTHFANPNGLSSVDHYTTARDLALIAQEAMANETFRQYVQTTSYVIPRTNHYWSERVLTNTNLMLYDDVNGIDVYGTWRPIKYGGTVGIKTGYTTEAGRCLVSEVDWGDVKLLAVVLGQAAYNNEVYRDTETLMEYGFHNFETVSLFGSAECSAQIPVLKGKVDMVGAIPGGDARSTLSKEDIAAIHYVYDLPESLEAPQEQGATVGQVHAYTGDVLLATVDMVLVTPAEKTQNIFERAGLETGTLSFAIKVAVLVIVLLIVIFLIVILRHGFKRSTFGRQLRWGGTSTHEIKRVKRIK